MDKRFIFRYRWRTIKSVRRTRWGRPGVAMEMQRPTSHPEQSGEEGGSPRATKDDPVDPCCQEKPRTGRRERPYRRPTLVGRSESSKAYE